MAGRAFPSQKQSRQNTANSANNTNWSLAKAHTTQRSLQLLSLDLRVGNTSHCGNRPLRDKPKSSRKDQANILASSYISLEKTKDRVPQYLSTLVWSIVSFALQLLYVPSLCPLERYHDYQLDTIKHYHAAIVANTSATCSFAVRHILLPLPQASPMRHNSKSLSGRDHPDRSLQHK